MLRIPMFAVSETHEKLKGKSNARFWLCVLTALSLFCGSGAATGESMPLSRGEERNATSVSPISRYCQSLQKRLRQEWRYLPGFDSPVVVDIDVKANGSITIGGAASQGSNSLQERATAMLLVSMVGQIEPPPGGPVKLCVVLCNSLDQLSVSVRNINWMPYADKVREKVRKAIVSPRSAQGSGVVTILKLRRNGEVESLQVKQRSTAEQFNHAVIEAVRKSAPFAPFPDGAPDTMDFDLCLEYDTQSAVTR